MVRVHSLKARLHDKTSSYNTASNIIELELGHVLGNVWGAQNTAHKWLIRRLSESNADEHLQIFQLSIYQYAALIKKTWLANESNIVKYHQIFAACCKILEHHPKCLKMFTIPWWSSLHDQIFIFEHYQTHVRWRLTLICMMMFYRADGHLQRETKI